MTASGTTPRAAALSTPLPPSASLSSGGQAAASSTSSWSRNGVRASSPWAMVMLSTRLTGSSTSITSVSRRSARSTAVAAPGRSNQAAANAREGSPSGGSASSSCTPASSRSKNSSAYVPSPRPGASVMGGYQE